MGGPRASASTHLASAEMTGTSGVCMSTYTQRYKFSTLSEADRLAIVKELSAWDSLVFHADGDPSGYWLDAKAADVILYVLRASADGAMLGYTTVKYYLVPYEGRELCIEKVGIGVLPEHRGNKFALRCLVTEYLRFRTRSPRRELYLFATLIHPVTYKLVCDVFGRKLYPYFEGAQDPDKERMAVFLANYFELRKANSPHPFVYVEDYSAIENRESNQYWKTSSRPEVRFFVEHCPNYDKSGDSIIATAPFDLKALIGSLGTLARNRLARLRKRKHRLSRAG